MAYTQPNSPFKQTTNGNINITSKILTKAEAAQAKQEEREEVKKNKENKKKKKKSSPSDGPVAMPAIAGEQNKRVTLPWDGKKSKPVAMPATKPFNRNDMVKF